MFPSLVIGLFGLCSCEREIGFDYHTVEPLYVVEASLSQTQTSVRISRTQDVTADGIGVGVEGATVVISSGDSLRVVISGGRNGYYNSTFHGEVGTRYRLDVEVEDRHFQSVSEMPAMPTMTGFRFVWMKVLTERMLMAELRLQDIPDATNYYFMHVYRNGLGYRWAIIRDSQRDADGALVQLFSCTTERAMRQGTDADALQEDDAIRIVVRSIDRRAYDYLYSLQFVESAGTNPIYNFTGGCLGYFSAFSQLTYECQFHLADVGERDDG